MNKLNPMEELNLSRNISEHWKQWKQELWLYITNTGKTKKSNEVKSNILLTYIEPRGRKVCKMFVFNKTTTNFSFIINPYQVSKTIFQ